MNSYIFIIYLDIFVTNIDKFSFTHTLLHIIVGCEMNCCNNFISLFLYEETTKERGIKKKKMIVYIYIIIVDKFDFVTSLA